MRRVRVAAYAKINLGLQIIRRRHDGYHDIVTVFQMIDLADEITVSNGERGVHIKSTGHFRVRENDSHLCARAARAYCNATGIVPAFDIVCRKNIPVGAGLGGGSSDAAATLRVLQSMHGTGAELGAIAARIGSDVAFFIRGGTAFGSGRGEQLTHAALRHATRVVLAMPRTGIGTSHAYGLLTPDDYSDGTLTEELFGHLGAGQDPLDLVDQMTNDFQAPIERHYPEAALLRLRLEECGAARAMLSGSGSCVFGLFADAGVADDCARELGATGYWTCSTKMLHFMPSVGRQ